MNVSLPGGVIDATVGPDATAEQTDSEARLDPAARPANGSTT